MHLPDFIRLIARIFISRKDIFHLNLYASPSVAVQYHTYILKSFYLQNSGSDGENSRAPYVLIYIID